MVKDLLGRRQIVFVAWNKGAIFQDASEILDTGLADVDTPAIAVEMKGKVEG
jgi:hypothetical protein